MSFVPKISSFPYEFLTNTIDSPSETRGFESHSLGFKFGPSEYANKLYQLLSHQIWNIHIRMVISCIHDFTLVSKYSTKLLL